MIYSNDKKVVRDFWDNASCGENLYLKGKSKDDYLSHSAIRYQLEPYILNFAEFDKWDGKEVLEVGVGLGADHQRFAEVGATLTGIDLTQRAVDYTEKRFEVFGLTSKCKVADAENLPFDDLTFDLVYSWGVLHHSPDTAKAIDEVYRVLNAGGTAKIMIYHKYSFVGFMLWLRHALFKLKPMTSLDYIYSHYLESPGTKAYSRADARKLFQKFCNVEIKTQLTHGDLLTSSAGQRHKGLFLSIARFIWPRSIIKTLFPTYGLFMLITAKK